MTDNKKKTVFADREYNSIVNFEEISIVLKELEIILEGYNVVEQELIAKTLIERIMAKKKQTEFKDMVDGHPMIGWAKKLIGKEKKEEE